MPDPHSTHATDEELLELALDSASDAQTGLLRHVHGCPRCRAAYDEISGVLDATLPASPAIAPPAGFESRVLARLDEVRPSTSRPARSRRVPLLVAAAAAAGLIVGAATATLVEREPASESTASGEHRLRTADGVDVGSVLPTRYQGRHVLVIAVEDARPGSEYACRLLLHDGTTLEVGTWTVPATGHGVWVAPLSATSDGVELVSTAADQVWATAELDG